MKNKIVAIVLIIATTLLLGCPTGTSENRATQPTISSSGGDLFEESTEITITGDVGSIIYYTLDGSDPSSTSTHYSAPFDIFETKTIKAIAVKMGFSDSLVKSETFTIMNKTTAPIITSSNGTPFETTTEVTITAADGAAIYYTIDGTVPTSASVLYSNSFEIDDTKTIKAIAVKDGNLDSNITNETYAIFPVKSFSVGKNYSFVLKSNGDLIEFGNNEEKQLGTGGVGHLYSPSIEQNNVKYISTSVYVSAFIDDDDKLFMMGDNGYGHFGDGSSLPENKSPVEVKADVTRVALGYRHSAIITTEGNLYTSGDNGAGQLGTGDTISTTSFQTSPIATGVKAVIVGPENGNTTFYITDDNELYAAGSNNQGQLGTGNTTNYSTFQLIQVKNALNEAQEIKDVSTSIAHTLILTTNGDLYGVGNNNDHSFKETDVDHYYEPELITNGIIKIATGIDCSFYIDNNNDLYGIGYNNFGLFGIGETSYNINEYTKLMSDVKDIKAYFNHILVLKTDGSMYAAGDNPYGCFGTGDQIDSKTFVRTLESFL